jgi:hypothetical protein
MTGGSGDVADGIVDLGTFAFRIACKYIKPYGWLLAYKHSISGWLRLTADAITKVEW